MKRFVKVELPPDEDGNPEIILIDLDRISLCEVDDYDDGDQRYVLKDSTNKDITRFDVNQMQLVVDAIEEALREQSWGDVPD